MKPSLPISITQEQLTKYVNGSFNDEEKKKIEKLLDDCQLSKEAVAGFAAFPSALADLPSLRTKIAARSGLQVAPKWMMNMWVGGAGVALVAAVYFFWPKKDQPVAQKIPGVEVVQTNPGQQPVPSAALLSPKSEHFVNPQAKISGQKKNISLAKDSVGTNAFSADVPEQIIPTASTQQLDAKPIIPIHPEPQYNASVGFILDLKVTDFEKYYSQTISMQDISLTGIPAEFENDKTKNSDDGETVRQIPADRFLRDALQAFRDGHYGRCIEKMEVLQKNNSSDVNALFYMGVSYVKLEMFGKAIPLLDEVVNSPNNVFREEAQWYKAQALIGSGDKDNAKKILNEIISQNGFYAQQATDLLKKN